MTDEPKDEFACPSFRELGLNVPSPSAFAKALRKSFEAQKEKDLAEATAPLLGRIAALEKLAETLKLEAQVHAQEARTANATIAEIYQACSGGTGEPGNWHGAAPVRQKIAALEAKLAQWVPDWNGLVEGERDQIVNEICEYGTGFATPLYAVVEGIERKLMERNAAPAAPEQQEPPPVTMMKLPNNPETLAQLAAVRPDLIPEMLGIMRAPNAQQAAQAACTYDDGGRACCEGGPCAADVHNESVVAQQAYPIDPAVAIELERSDWTPEEALRWYAAGRHYDTVPNGDGTSSARILDNGAVASNALKSMSREYAEHKGDVALESDARQPSASPAEREAQPVAWINYRIKCDNAGNFAGHGAAELSFDRGSYGYDWNRSQPLYTSPPKAVPLTEAQRHQVVAKWKGGNGTASDIIDAVEAAHGIGTGD